MTDHDDPVERYLADLDAQAASLPAEVRTELLTDVRAHLAEVAHRDPRPLALRQAMDDLGSPSTLVAAAREELGTMPGSTADASAASGATPWATNGSRSKAGRSGGIGRELLAFALAVPGPIVALVVARVIGGSQGAEPTLLVLPPLVTLLAGWALIWSSVRWQLGEKLLANVLWPFGFVAPLALGAMPSQRCVVSGDGVEVCEGLALSPWIGVPLLLLLIAAPLVGSGWLFTRAQRRARASDAVDGPVRTPTP